MKTNVWVSGTFFAFFLLLFFFFLRSNKSVTDLESALLVQPVEQNVPERIWRRIEYKQIGISREFIYSSHITIGLDGYIYAADSRRLVVQKFDTQANLAAHLGAGEGRGPGEFLIITDLIVDPSGNVWVLDPRNNRLTIFNQGNPEEWKIIDFPEIPNRVIPMGTDQYWLEKRFDNQLRRYTHAGDQLGELRAIVDDPILWSVVLESRYVPAQDGSLVLTQYHTNYLAKYSSEGEIEFFRKPVVSPELPKIDPHFTNDVARVNTVDFSTWQQITRRPYIVKDTFHVFIWDEHAPNEERQWRQKTVDVYDLENGDYLFSYELPEQLHAMAVSPTHLAGISDDLGLIVWEVVGGWN